MRTERTAVVAGGVGALLAPFTPPVVGAQDLRCEELLQEAAPAETYQSHEVRLLSHLPLDAFPGAVSFSDCWGYTSTSGREYALVGLDNGTAFVEVTDPMNPVVVSQGGGPVHFLRDIKTFGDMAYSGNTIRVQIFDMSNIDAGAVTGVGVVSSGGLIGAHNLAVDEVGEFLYTCDDGGALRGIRAYDLGPDPANPTFSGEFQTIRVHDAQVVTYTSGSYAGREIAFCLGPDTNGNNHGLRILDVTDKSNMFIRREVFWPNATFSHQGWLSDDRQYFYINDELDESVAGLSTTTYVVDVGDLDTAFLAATFDNGNAAIGHNLYVRGTRLFESNFASGLRVFDLAVSALGPPEVAWFDTRSLDDLPAVNAQFSNYPFFASGIVIGTDMQEGLFAWWADAPLIDIQLASPEPATLPASGASLLITMTEQSAGDLVLGTEKLHYSTGGAWQNVPLVPLGGGTYRATFPALPCPAVVSYYLCADSPNGVEWALPIDGPRAPFQAPVGVSESIVFQDDFENPNGWTASNLGAVSGDWERGLPIDDPTWPYDPPSDSDGSGQCALTENALGDTDVDDGSVVYTSPVLDLSGPNALVQFDYYLYINDQKSSDGLTVEASEDGLDWRTVAFLGTSGFTAWRTHRITAGDLLQAGVTPGTTNQLRFTAADTAPETIVEAGLDAFFVKNVDCAPGLEYCTSGTSANGCRATITATGAPSATATSGFYLTATSVEGAKDGLFFIGLNGRQANPWGSGTSYQCVVPPVFRGGLLIGSGTPGACDGSFGQDWNALWCATCPKPAKNPGAGALVQAQLWYRDPFNTSNLTTSLSNAFEFTVAP